ncbi:hypothetical protein ACOMHN_000317 [Nucella lapillus]
MPDVSYGGRATLHSTIDFLRAVKRRYAKRNCIIGTDGKHAPSVWRGGALAEKLYPGRLWPSRIGSIQRPRVLGLKQWTVSDPSAGGFYAEDVSLPKLAKKVFEKWKKPPRFGDLFSQHEGVEMIALFEA